MLNPELRARRIVNVIQYSSIEFYKAFLFLGETGNLLIKNSLEVKYINKNNF